MVDQKGPWTKNSPATFKTDMLTCENAILVSIDAAEGVGRTALQKIVFFAKELKLTIAAYDPHYYGPYSREVASILMNLVAVGWVEESAEAWPDGSLFGERRRYSYRLTAAGKSALQQLVVENHDASRLRDIVKLCKEKTRLDFEIISFAAKIHFMRVKLQQNFSPEKIEEHARSWGWQVKKEDVPKVTGLLDSLQLSIAAA